MPANQDPIEPPQSLHQSRYLARMRKVLHHIDAHLDDGDADLSLASLSAVAAFSRFHFHRQFTALLGITLHDHVRSLRMKRAAWQLAFRADSTITHIALACGYESPEAFARAFRQRYGQSPSAFRAQPDWAAWQAAHDPIDAIRSTHMAMSFQASQVGLVDFPATRVAVLTHHGDPALLGATIQRFIAWRRARGLSPKLSPTFNILHVDPDTTAPQDYRIDLAVGTALPIDANEEGVREGLIPAGRCAVLRLVGSSDNVRAAVSYLYADWLPRSGEELRDFPVFLQRVSFFPDVPEHEAVTDVFLPLA